MKVAELFETNDVAKAKMREKRSGMSFVPVSTSVAKKDANNAKRDNTKIMKTAAKTIKR